MKKCAAIECLLSATDDDQWPVEKLVDELCTRLKLLQLEQGATGAAMVKQRWAGLGSSAPDCFECPSSDSDSFTSVSSPEVDQDNYRHDFPPLEYLSDSDQVDYFFLSFFLPSFLPSFLSFIRSSSFNILKNLGRESQQNDRIINTLEMAALRDLRISLGICAITSLIKE